MIKIFRRACLPEDEGRDHFVKSCNTRKEAEAWIEAQEGEYFRPGDYYIV